MAFGNTMLEDEIIRLAIQCQLVNASNRDGIYMNALLAFAKLVAAKEREACAKVCDDMVLYTGYDCAAAIRARAQEC